MLDTSYPGNKAEVEFRVTIQFSLLLLDMKVRPQLTLVSVQVDLLPYFRIPWCKQIFRWMHPASLPGPLPSVGSTNLIFPPYYLQIQTWDKYFYPWTIIKKITTPRHTKCVYVFVCMSDHINWFDFRSESFFPGKVGFPS